MKRHNKVAATITGYILGAVLALSGATPANAWVWDSHVRITGFARCATVSNALSVPASEITIRVRATGESRTVSVNGLTGYYGADFYALPVAGSWADENIHCIYAGTNTWRYGRSAFMFRPSYGN
jgi:hypothetical protein